VHRRYYVEIKCQLDATDDIYCRFYCMHKICNKYHLLHLVGILFPHSIFIVYLKSISIFIVYFFKIRIYVTP